MLPRRFPASQLSRCTRPQQTHACRSSARPQKQFHLIVTRSKQTNADKKAAISRAISNNEQSATEPVGDNIFGMRPIDYTILPPIHASPPPPPPRPGLGKYIFPISVVIFAGIVGYFYVNNKNDNLEFWSAMEKGEAIDVDVDDDDEDDE